MKLPRFFVALLGVVCCASAAHAARLDGSVFLLSVDPDFRSAGRADFYNDLNQVDYSAELSGRHAVNGPVTFFTPVQGSGTYFYILEGPVDPGACYNTTLDVSGDPPGWFNTLEGSWIGERKCAPAPPPPPPPPPGGGDDNGTPSEPCEGCSPIIIDVRQDGYALTGSHNGVIFDINGDGSPEHLSWTAPGGDDAFLWLDENGNGVVDDGNELFGDARYPNGFEKLALYDAAAWGGNNDGQISAADASWAALCVWTDSNHNGISEPDEILPLAGIGVSSIDLKYEVIGKKDRFGNLFRFKSSIETATGKDKIYDVIFVRRNPRN